MPREKKDARILNPKLAAPVYDRPDAFCYESGPSKTVAAEKILMQFFDSYLERPEDTSESGGTAACRIKQSNLNCSGSLQSFTFPLN